MTEDTKRYTMLKTVQGSNNGIDVQTYEEGETYELGPDLATNFYHQGAVKEASKNPADKRERKVSGPDEAKVETPSELKEGEAGVPLETQGIEELVSLGRDKYGLELDSTMSVEDARAAIEAAQGETEATEPLTTEGSKSSGRKSKK